MTRKVYEWKMEGFARGIDPEAAVDELSRIEMIYGTITAKNILQASIPKDALFHKLFTWDNKKAAFRYRLAEARRLIKNISVRIISNGQPVHISVYEVVTHAEGRQYFHIDNFRKEDVDEIRRNVLAQFNSIKAKLALYKQFDKIRKKIEQTAEMLANS